MGDLKHGKGDSLQYLILKQLDRINWVFMAGESEGRTNNKNLFVIFFGLSTVRGMLSPFSTPEYKEESKKLSEQYRASMKTNPDYQSLLDWYEITVQEFGEVGLLPPRKSIFHFEEGEDDSEDNDSNSSQ